MEKISDKRKIVFVKKVKISSNELEHKTTKEIMAFLEEEHVTNFVIGHVSGIEKNTKKNSQKKRKTNKKRRQQLILVESGENQAKTNL